MDIKELQSQYESINERINSFNKEKKSIINQAECAGYMLKGSIFVKDEPIYGIFYDFEFYSHFDGHRSGAVNDYYIGSQLSSLEDFNTLKQLIQDNDLGEEEQIYELIQDTPLDSVGIELDTEFMSHFKIISDTEIIWEYEGGDDQGELRSGSYFTIKLTTQSELKKVKNKEYTKID
jgi:hypothetical protein